MSIIGDLVMLGSGEATSPQPDLFDPKVRATVRYADPAAWTMAAAIARALAEAKPRADLTPHEAGIISISDTGTRETMAVVGEAAAQGQASPLRYPAAGPGSLAGVACISFGLRGPTLNLTMLPADGVPVALTMSKAWLNRHLARQVILATLIEDDSKNRIARAMLLTLSTGVSGPARPVTQSLFDWLVTGRPTEVKP
ncbi:MAG: hypothetical protein ACLPXB_10200 [Thiobacillaceae bacterium]